MRIVELILDEDQEIGIEAISVVENPAIEESKKVFPGFLNHRAILQTFRSN